MRIAFVQSRSAALVLVLLKILFGAILLTGCVTEKSTKRYLNEHPKVAAKYCAAVFPVITKTDSVYVIDSTRRKSVEDSLTNYADSLLDILEEDKPVPGQPCPTYNIDSIRKAITLQIKRFVKPCLDSTKVITVEKLNTAQLEVANGVIGDLQAELARKDETISKRDDRISKLEGKIDGKNKLIWWLIGIVIAETLYITRKLWLPLLTGIKIPFIK